MGLFDFLTGGASKKRDTTYNGPRPVSSITKGALGGQLKDTLSKRIAGEGVGIPGSPGKTFGSSIANRIRGRFDTRTRPELESELTKLGVRRSSGGFNRLADQIRQNEFDAGAVQDEIDLQNELLKRQEIANAIASGQEFNLADVNQLNTFSNFEKGLHNDQITQEAARQQAKAQAIKGLIGAGAGLAYGDFGGNPVGSNLLQELISRYASKQTTPIPFTQFQGAGGIQPTGIADPRGFVAIRGR